MHYKNISHRIVNRLGDYRAPSKYQQQQVNKVYLLHVLGGKSIIDE